MDATVAWLPPSAEQAPDEGRAREARSALERWARTRGLRLVTATSHPTAAIPVDMDVADSVEAELGRAHDATTADDADGADRALAHAEGLLRVHPELPNAAWLMAEVHRSWSTRWSRLPPSDPERASLEWQRGAALDGGRSAGVGERAAPREGDIDAALAIAGDGQALLDGRPASAGPLRVARGEHQLVVEHAGRVLWAEWVSFAPSATVRVAVPEPVPCSSEDLARATIQGGAVHANSVRCGAWVAVGEGSRAGSLLVATCEGGTCGTALEWSSGLPSSGPPPGDGVAPAHHWPTWATWTLVGAGVALTAVGVTLAATGAFHSSPSEVQFVSNGLHTSGLRF